MGKEEPDGGFDEEALDELQQDMGEAMAEFVSGFLTNMDATRLRMRDSLRASSLDTVGEIAHALKGTAGYLGAVELVRTLGEIQRSCAESAPPREVELLLDRVDELAEKVRRRLELLSKD